MKGLILCAGKGTRMRPITWSLPKQLIPVANKPVIYYAFESFRDAGIKDVGIVVSGNRDAIEPHLHGGKPWGLNFAYIEQKETLGIAHAVLSAEEFIGADEFLLYLGDNLLEKGFADLVSAYGEGSQDGAIMLKEVPEPEHFGVAEVDDGRIISIVEKPQNPKSNLAVIGVYIFNSKVFEAAKNIKPSPRGELEITDTIAELIRMGCKVTPHVVRGWWKDTGRKSDMIEANRALLESIESDIKGKTDDGTTISGELILDEGAEIIGSRVRGPVVIGKGTKIINSTIGPYASIADNVRVENCDIANSIVMNDTRLTGIKARVESSLIGSNVVIESVPGESNVMDVVVGDKCRVLLPE